MIGTCQLHSFIQRYKSLPSPEDASLGFPCPHYPRLVGVVVESDAPEALSVSHFDWIAQLFWKRQKRGFVCLRSKVERQVKWEEQDPAFPFSCLTLGDGSRD